VTTPIPLALGEVTLLLREGDDVVVALRDLQSGTTLSDDGGRPLTVTQSVPRGHKLAVRDVPTRAPVRKYGQAIGVATRDIAVGDHVHSHNLGMTELAQDFEFGTARVVPVPPSGQIGRASCRERAEGRVVGRRC